MVTSPVEESAAEHTCRRSRVDEAFHPSVTRSSDFHPCHSIVATCDTMLAFPMPVLTFELQGIPTYPRVVFL